jgi:hypothetical protein
MNAIGKSNLRRSLNDETGQVLPWMALLMVLFLGMAGLTVDLGRAWVCYRELQASTDAAALAGAYAMTLSGATTSSVTNEACLFSSSTIGAAQSHCSVAGTNGTPNLPVVSVTPSLKCVSGVAYVAVPCSAAALGDNVIQVTQTATIPTYFIQGLAAFGIKTARSLTLNATSSATLSGTTPPVAVAILIDTTASMNTYDPGCSDTSIHCALQGVQTLLEQVPTCAETDPTTGACTVHNYVGLFTFPNVQASSVSADTTCSGGGNPNVVDYSWPAAPSSTPSSWDSWTPPTGNQPTYEIAGFTDSFNTGTGSASKLSSSSPVVIATGAGGCNGLQAKGGVQTYYAGAINEAQTALMAQVNGDASIQKIMIILSDGAANSGSIASPASSGYGSEVDECSQAIAAAANASALGTKVYTIAYSSEATGCTTDTSGTYKNIAPCQTMQYMATGYLQGDHSNFYSDAGSASVCGTTGAALPTIFSNIVTNFSQGRLIPNNVGG